MRKKGRPPSKLLTESICARPSSTLRSASTGSMTPAFLICFWMVFITAVLQADLHSSEQDCAIKLKVSGIPNLFDLRLGRDSSTKCRLVQPADLAIYRTITNFISRASVSLIASLLLRMECSIDAIWTVQRRCQIHLSLT